MPGSKRSIPAVPVGRTSEIAMKREKNLGNSDLTIVDDHGKYNPGNNNFQKQVLRMAKDWEMIAISEFKATCLKVLEQVRRTGDSVLITRRGEPIALVSPPPPPEKPSSWLGMFQGQGKIVGDIVSPVLAEEAWEVLKK